MHAMNGARRTFPESTRTISRQVPTAAPPAEAARLRMEDRDMHARHRWAIVLTVLALAWGAGGDSHAEGFALFFGGQKWLDDGDWPVGDEQAEIGILTCFGSDEWPVLIAVDLLGSADDGDAAPVAAALDQFTLELDLGVRKVWKPGDKTRPFLGGGLAFIRGGHDLIVLPGIVGDDSDSATGAWIDGGVVWRLRKNFILGLEARYSTAEIDLEREVDAGGRHLGLVLGRLW